MEYEEDEKSEFLSSEIEWGDESSHYSWEREGDYLNEPWSGETNSEISFKGENERVEESWPGETNSEISLEEESEHEAMEINRSCEEKIEEEDDQKRDLWYEDEYLDFDFEDKPQGEEFEPGPPDYSQDDTSQHIWSKEEETDQEECVREGSERDSWHEEIDSEISLEEEFNKEEPEHKGINPEEEPYQYKDSLEETATIDDELWSHESEPEDSFGNEIEIEEEEPEQLYISFSGHSQGLEAYTRWEQDMDNWFQSNQVLEEEKMTYAEETLTEDAFRHWEREDYMRMDFDEPAYSWEDIKKIMYEEFVKDVEANKQYYVKIDSNPKPRRWILATRSYPKAKPKKACYP
ncbi:unnamed protein product [Arabis nemorensis]|uniref:Uncharacterized protein n=1 Tax=Arabis nemorensis TaxID=586526 RepID=A0A565BLJ7_9BRAS|nr:unnamed protein product [Arabis nemorensis]